MIVYLDTSAVVPILIAEPSTETCRRISAAQHDEVRSNLDEIWPDVDVIELTEQVASSAAKLARSLSLRGYDAVHCASAAGLNDPELVAVAGDSRLLGAWRELGVAVLDTSKVG